MYIAWTEKEDEFIRLNYSNKGLDFCKTHLPNRTRNAIKERAKKFKIQMIGNIRYKRPKMQANQRYCFQCKQVLSLDSFAHITQNRDIGKFGRLGGSCKECEKIRQKNHKMKYPERYMINSSRINAKIANVPHTIIAEDIKIPKFCPVLGIKLCINFGRAKGNSPSIDKLIPEKGYVKDNIDIISYRANWLKNNATFEEIEKLYFWMKKKFNK